MSHGLGDHTPSDLRKRPNPPRRGSASASNSKHFVPTVPPMIIRALRACRATLTLHVGLLSAAALIGASVLATTAVLAPTAATEPAGATVPSAPAATPLAAPRREVPPRRVVPRASRGGRTVLKTVASGRSFSGPASWYGAELHGNRTASGERFDMHDLTAASKTLPFGTRLRVCLAHNPGRCVVVRVNDRGPYVGSRVLDLSAAARRALGFSGVARVTATPVERLRVPISAPTPAAVSPGTVYRRLPAAVRAANEPPPASAPLPSVVRAATPDDARFGQVTVLSAVLGWLVLALVLQPRAPRLALPKSKELPWSSRSSARRLA
jgi:rare lipoprotein A